MKRIFNRAEILYWNQMEVPRRWSFWPFLNWLSCVDKLDLFNLFKHVWTGELMLETPTDYNNNS